MAQFEMAAVASDVHATVADLHLVPPRHDQAVAVRSPLVTSGRARRSKRALDIGLTVAALPALLIIAPLIALAIRLDSRGPALFRQHRLTRGGRRFEMLKFRSMYTNAEEILAADPALYQRYVDHGFKLPPECDPRITRVGRFLRKSSLDELPQLVNVLRGDMSLVGPRPIVPSELDELYGTCREHYLAVQPGLTGLWQVSGRSTVVGPDRAVLDCSYVENWTLRGDVSLIARTLPATLKAHGAH
jgi:lipopolysaccharide/colanic/teichoic acid biosynthesis glycosyltransferase